MKVRKTLLVLLIIIPAVLTAGNLGVGVIIGSPTGLSLKYLVSRSSALSAHAGWSFIGNAGIHVTADYQYLFPTVFTTEEGATIDDFTPYIAVGGRFRFKEVDGVEDDTEFHLGIRMGGGIEYNVSRFGIFLEVLPVVDIVPSTDFDLEGGLGFLFYF